MKVDSLLCCLLFSFAAPVPPPPPPPPPPLLEAQNLVVTYNCRKSGWTPVTVRIPFLPEGSVTFTVNKTCEVKKDSNGSRRPAKAQASVPGLKMMLNDEQSTVIVSDGLTAAGFTEGSVKSTRKAVVRR